MIKAMLPKIVFKNVVPVANISVSGVKQYEAFNKIKYEVHVIYLYWKSSYPMIRFYNSDKQVMQSSTSEVCALNKKKNT